MDINKNIDIEEKQRDGKTDICSIECEPQDTVLEKVVNRQRDAVVESAHRKLKVPNMWVQFQKTIRNTSTRSNDHELGRQSADRAKHFQPEGSGGGGGFVYDRSRNGFVLKVFVILLVMLAVTAMYAVIVAAMSNVVAVFTSIIKTHIIMYALLATSITVAVCLMLALSSFDFTAWYLYLVVIMCVFAALSLMLLIGSAFFGIRFKLMHTIMLYVGTLIQVVLLIMELQMILGGRSIEMGEDEYVLAAYCLYTSIINLFLHFVKILADLDF
ncbi:protein lifeguard 1-like [Bicyclus anynana]|uniref:Protein lifeguard 1-like n=1 Tax=Bicyclus anynana TaxID=110368 RepID=A0ABM3LPG9_BICAN|nr:protein lifeguard 1-like [Bicyclus anynana]